MIWGGVMSYMGKGMTPFGFYSYVSRLDSVDTPFL